MNNKSYKITGISTNDEAKASFVYFIYKRFLSFLSRTHTKCVIFFNNFLP